MELELVRDGWGRVLALETEISVYAPDGTLTHQRQWESRSFTLWFGRIIKGLFENAYTPVSPLPLTDQTGTPFTPAIFTGIVGGLSLVQRPSSENPPDTGAMMAVGDGAAAEISGRTDLVVNRATQDARLSTITTTINAVKIEFFTVEGITITDTAVANITEVGLFVRLRTTTDTTGINPRRVLIAYDEVSPAIPVSTGSVIAPKYTMSFVA